MKVEIKNSNADVLEELEMSIKEVKMFTKLIQMNGYTDQSGCFYDFDYATVQHQNTMAVWVKSTD